MVIFDYFCVIGFIDLLQAQDLFSGEGEGGLRGGKAIAVWNSATSSTATHTDTLGWCVGLLSIQVKRERGAKYSIDKVEWRENGAALRKITQKMAIDCRLYFFFPPSSANRFDCLHSRLYERMIRYIFIILFVVWIVSFRSRGHFFFFWKM